MPATGDVIQTTDGEVWKGRILEAREDGILFETESGQIFFQVDRIEPRSFHLARTRAIGLDPGARYRLGEFCQTRGLVGEARREYERAGAADLSLSAKVAGRMRELDSLEAQFLLERALERAASGDVEGARRKLERLLSEFATDRLAGPARIALESLPPVDARTRAVESSSPADAASDARPEFEAALDAERRYARKMAELETCLETARAEGAEAIDEAARGKVSAAARALVRAESAYTAAIAALRGARAQASEVDTLESLFAREHSIVRAYAKLLLERAKLAFRDRNWTAASTWNEKSLDLDPASVEARELASEIGKFYRKRSLKKWLNIQDRVE